MSFSPSESSVPTATSREPTREVAVDINSAIDRRGRRAWWLPVAGVVFATALVVYAWQRQAGRTSAAAQVTTTALVPSVRVHVVARADSEARLTLPATLEPAQRTEIHARASGYVKRWHADLGQRVEAGEALAELETPDLEQDVRKSEAAVAEARANLALAQTSAERFRQLMRENAVARQELDTREAELSVRQAALVSAEAALSRVRELTRFQIVRAPYAGLVTARRVEVGDLVVAGAAGDGLFVIEQTDTLRAFVDLPQTYVRGIAPKMKARFQLPEAPGQIFEAEVVRTAGALDSGTRSMRVELQIPNPAGELMAGAFGQVRFTLPRSRNAFAVPVTAVRIRAEGATVALVDASDEIQLRPIKLGHDLGNEIEVIDGLRPGERVVRNPTDQLRPGTKVRVVQVTAQK